MAIILYGQAIGLPEVVALDKIQIVNGRMCILTTVLQALFQKQGGRVKILERSDEKARVELSKPGWEPYIHEYTKADAVAEGLWGKDNWKKRPKTQLLYRAISGGLRVYDPGSHLGVITVEEMEDYPGGFPETPAQETPKLEPAKETPKPEKTPLRGSKGRKKADSPPPAAEPKPEEEEPPPPEPPESDDFMDGEEEDPLEGPNVNTGDPATSGGDPEIEETVQQIKEGLEAKGVDEKEFKTWLIEYQGKMKTPHKFLIRLGKAIRYNRAEKAELDYLLTALGSAVDIFIKRDALKK
jgi:hypothetical protein